MVKMYISITSYIGVPALYKANIEGNSINATINWDTMADAVPQTRAGGEYNTVPAGYVALGSWNVNGRPNYLNSEGSLQLSTSILNTINKTIEEGKVCDPKYRQSADFEVYDDQNRLTEVKVRFVGGTSNAASAFGYYCYKSGDSKEKIANAKKYVVFPNTKTGVGIKGGECVQLHYIDENGVDQGTDFPNGTKIGWFIINDAFGVKNAGTSGSIGNGYGVFYSTTALNSDGRTHTAAFRINDFVVLSFEDWTDSDYNDVQFNVWSNPREAIITPELPDVKPEGPDDDTSIAYRMTYKGILAFEDNWPTKGDYDLNDVVVKYNSVLCFNTKNQVLATEDAFTTLWSGASYRNGFAYQMNTDRSNVECEFLEGGSWGGQGLDKDLSSATVNVFYNALEQTGNNTKTSTFKISNKFKSPVDHETFGAAPYNPFIFVHQNTGFSRTEVHLVNHKPTDKINNALFHTGEDLSVPEQSIYYVSSSNYPFAINLVDAEKFRTEERELIDKSYPRFVSWVVSNGSKDKDWYLKK